jgi:hypothetical protein
MSVELCSTHTHDLYAMLQKKELGGMVTRDALKSAAFGTKWLQGLPIAFDEFDPYVVSVFEINAKAQQMLGVVSGCPLCAAGHILRSNADKEWIDNVTDLMQATVMHLKAQRDAPRT